MRTQVVSGKNTRSFSDPYLYVVPAYRLTTVAHLTPDDRQPLLNWPRQIPIEGEPEDVVALVNEYGAFMASSDMPKLFINADPGMASSDMPKLFINADPGSLLVGPQREFCRSWP